MPAAVISLAVNVVAPPEPKVMLSPYVCKPDVVTLPPLMAVVPVASVVTLAALTVPPNVPVTDVFNVNAPIAPFTPAPTLPDKVIPPEPALIVKARAAVTSRSIVDANVTKLFVVLMVVSAPSVTGLL